MFFGGGMLFCFLWSVLVFWLVYRCFGGLILLHFVVLSVAVAGEPVDKVDADAEKLR